MLKLFRNYFMILRCIILVVLIPINIYFQYNGRYLIMLLFFSFISIIMTNEYLRNVKLKDQNKYTYISLLFSIYSAAVLEYFVSGPFPTAYLYCFLFEILQLKKDIMKFFFSVNLLLIILVYTLNYEPLNLNIKLLAFIITSVLYSAIIIREEKEKIIQLNKKLKLANIKLQEYTLQVEEVTISRERTRVAQELHDSLGHSLMALAMHLEFAKKICTTKPEKVEEVLAQSEKIAKASINDLRKAVTLLNSELEIKDFNTTIKKLINNFYLFSNIQINYNNNNGIDSLSPVIKTSIYKTIQESITNSLKHGNATEINIKITTTSENVEFIITDNGIGCNNIIKSNGLNGIESRINLLNGTISYFSHNNLGFGIMASIPI